MWTLVIIMTMFGKVEVFSSESMTQDQCLREQIVVRAALSTDIEGKDSMPADYTYRVQCVRSR